MSVLKKEKESKKIDGIVAVQCAKLKKASEELIDSLLKAQERKTKASNCILSSFARYIYQSHLSNFFRSGGIASLLKQEGDLSSDVQQFRPERDLNPDLCDACAVRFRLAIVSA
ncbi:hypothetical protein P5673_030755 [Acropora cervicornis]|uniref:Uncharacterized protein n=1 Tax=Acropora cervicornis TaxID=6130 RepID=A0AAD9PU50_ACRCE|nr:hypothetical protein P5673_030755 [Acropora cervicornis]